VIRRPERAGSAGGRAGASARLLMQINMPAIARHDSGDHP
jgi:hypothetical protein